MQAGEVGLRLRLSYNSVSLIISPPDRGGFLRPWAKFLYFICFHYGTRWAELFCRQVIRLFLKEPRGL
jgi:hypothetical protein